MELTSNQIAKILPQSYPFLMLDRVVDFKKGESLTAVKNITGNEWMFGSSLTPFGATFPETLLIEAAAQAAILFRRLSTQQGQYAHNGGVRLGKTKAEFFKSVHVGDQVELRTSSYKFLETSGYVDVEVFVGKEMVGEVSVFYSVAV